ncbi:MAG: hypothetical protein GY705_28100 [Bacteroidetes bacterium]|nr:hypothetical protein [Bacteroidota bacterium]
MAEIFIGKKEIENAKDCLEVLKAKDSKRSVIIKYRIDILEHPWKIWRTDL